MGRRERPDDVEGSERESAQRHLAASRNRGIDPAVAQVPERLPERDAPRGTRVGRRQDRAANVERDPEIGRGRTAEHRQGEVRRHLADSLVHVPLVLGLRVGDATERAAEVDPDPLGARGVGGAGDEAGVVEREPTGHEAELAEPVELPGDLRLEKRQRVEVVNLGCDLRAECGRIEAVDPPDRGAGRPQAGPEGVDTRPDRRDHADPGHEHPASCAHGDAVDVGELSESAPFVGRELRLANASVAGAAPALATASAIALNVASVRPAIGRVKNRSMNGAHGANRGRKSCSIVTRQPPPFASIDHVTSMPFVAPPWWMNRIRQVCGSLHVRDRHATGRPTPSGPNTGRRAIMRATTLPSGRRSRIRTSS